MARAVWQVRVRSLAKQPSRGIFSKRLPRAAAWRKPLGVSSELVAVDAAENIALGLGVADEIDFSHGVPAFGFFFIIP